MKSTLFVSLGALALAAGCARPGPEAKTEAPAVAVSIGRAERTGLPSSFEAGGVVRARTTAAVASRIMAPIVAVHVRPGDRVRAGAALVTLDAREITASAAQAAAALASASDAVRAADSETRAAEAALGLARLTHERIRGLHEKQSATTQELDQARAALDASDAQVSAARARASAAASARQAAQAAVDGAKVAVSYATVNAPFDGLVTQRLVDPGSMATPGTPLVTLEDPTTFRLEVQMDEARASQITVGRTAEVEFDPAGDTPAGRIVTSARVAEVARVDPASHSFLVKLDLPNDPALRSGVFGRARFAGPTRQTLSVPASAIVRRGQLAFAFVVEGDGRARLQPVSPGASVGDRTEVLAGVREGEQVVIQPPASLSDGARVSGGRR